MNKLLLSFACTAVIVLAGCASPIHRAPVEDRRTATAPAAQNPPASLGTAPSADAPKPLPGAENAGKPGYYAVKPGDTVLRVALETGQNWRDIVRWNNMDNPNMIEVGQVLRVVPPPPEAAAPVAAAASAVGPKPVITPKIDTKPLDAGKPSVAPAASAISPAAQAASPPPPPAQSVPSAGGDDDVVWAWPAARSAVSAGFDETRSRGMVFLGKSGDPVLAAADGKVIYAGNGLRGYGNLLIIRHNSSYLTAYAHNQTLLVKEDQTVKRGQKVAEMGSSDADRVQLQFELRRLGKPMDPSKLLPPR